MALRLPGWLKGCTLDYEGCSLRGPQLAGESQRLTECNLFALGGVSTPTNGDLRSAAVTHMDNGLVAILVPIFGIVFGVGGVLAIPILIVIMRHRTGRELIQRYHAERMAAIERGMDLPPWEPEVLQAQMRHRPRTSLLPGLVWFFIGIALLVFFMDISSRDTHAPRYIGLIPTAVGLAYLVYYFVEGREIERKHIESQLQPKSQSNA